MAKLDERAALRLYTTEQLRAADARAESAGVARQLLIEAAGRAVAEAVLEVFPACGRPVLLCGPGDNGGDGYVAARYLITAGIPVQVVELSTEPASAESRLARTALLPHLGGSRQGGASSGSPVLLGRKQLTAALAQSDLLVDALFGSGLDRPLTGELARVVHSVNKSGLPVLAVDVPSGVSADSPALAGPAVRATATVQLAGAKLASAFSPAREQFGRQFIARIGLPAEILAAAADVRLLAALKPLRRDHDSQAAAWLHEIDPGGSFDAQPRRKRDAHKYEAGTVLVVAGSQRYLGAAELACRGAWRAGAGFVTLASGERPGGSWPETVFEKIDWDMNAVAQLSGVPENRVQVVVAGPGLDERALAQLPELLARYRVPWVLDAAALQPDPHLREAVTQHGRCVNSSATWVASCAAR